MNLFLIAGIVFLVFAVLIITELSLRTGFFKIPEETKAVVDKKSTIKKRWRLLTLFLLCWTLSYFSLWYFLSKTLPKELVVQNVGIFFIGTFLIFLFTYKIVRPWKEDEEDIPDDIKYIGTEKTKD